MKVMQGEVFTWLFSTSPETSVDPNLQIFFLLLNSWTSSPGGNWSKWERLVVYLPWLSMCKDSACPWWDPHSPLDIWEALSVLPVDSKLWGGVAVGFWGGWGFKSLRATKSCSSPPIHICMAKTNCALCCKLLLSGNPKTAAFLFCLLIVGWSLWAVWIHTPTILLSPVDHFTI